MADTDDPTYSGGSGAGHLMTQALKMVCPVCNGTIFEVAEDCVDRNTLNAWDTGYGDAGTDVILFKCVGCGNEHGRAKALFETAQ
jgi:hypothetical protein